MTLAELQERCTRGAPPEVEIISVEGLIYIVRIDADRLLTKTRDAADTLRFRSVYAAGKALARAGVGSAWLVHQSPYDEMVGRPDEHLPHPAPLRTRVTITEL